MSVKRDPEFFYLKFVCWCFLEKTQRFLARHWKECRISGFVFGAIPSNFTRKLCHLHPPWKIWHVQHRKAHAPVLTPPLQWACMRQPHSPELLLLQRRAGYWRREPFKRLLIKFSIPQYLQFPLESQLCTWRNTRELIHCHLITLP